MKLLRSFGYALEGTWYLICQERNIRIELAAALCAVLLGRTVSLSAGEWAALFAVMAVVLGLEGVNTAIERCVDLVTLEKRPLAKAAKDCAAGAVLLSALMSLGAGACLFLSDGRGRVIAFTLRDCPFAAALFIAVALLFVFLPGDGRRGPN